MVYNENLYSLHTDIIKDLYEPYIGKIKIRYLCYPIALLFIFEDAFQLYLTFINYYQRPDPYYTHVNIPVNYCLRSFGILSAIFLIYGAQKPKSTPIALFLWTQLEINVLYVIFFCYEAMTELLKSSERYEEYGILIMKIVLWAVVNTYHNFVKEKDFLESGQERTSKAFTEVIKYRLAGQKTSV